MRDVTWELKYLSFQKIIRFKKSSRKPGGWKIFCDVLGNFKFPKILMKQ